MPAENYTIDFDGATLFACAKHYIPFEVNKADPGKAQQIRAFKNELAERIRALEIAPQDVLVAQYGETGTPRFYDTENMCIYNLGTSVFSAGCSTDIAFAALSPDKIDKFQRRFGAKPDQGCFYAYSMVAKEELEKECNSRRLIADWDHIGIDTKRPNTPQRYWESIRSQYKDVCVHQALKHPEADCFGIKVTLHLPKKILPASVMKPLLDGIVCAFHQREGIDDVLRTVAGDRYEEMVVDAENNIGVLGKMDYVKPYRGKSLKWNPADERLKFAWVSTVNEDVAPYFEGSLFVW